MWTNKDWTIYCHENIIPLGLLAGDWPCGVLTMIDELSKSASKSQVYGSLHGFMYTNPATTDSISKFNLWSIVCTIQKFVLVFNIDILCYDDGCHLRKYARNPIRANKSATAVKLAELNIVIDKMHFSGHIDEWCKTTCNPYKIKELDKVYMHTILIDWHYNNCEHPTWI